MHLAAINGTENFYKRPSGRSWGQCSRVSTVTCGPGSVLPAASGPNVSVTQWTCRTVLV